MPPPSGRTSRGTSLSPLCTLTVLRRAREQGRVRRLQSALGDQLPVRDQPLGVGQTCGARLAGRSVTDRARTGVDPRVSHGAPCSLWEGYLEQARRNTASRSLCYPRCYRTPYPPSCGPPEPGHSPRIQTGRCADSGCYWGSVPVLGSLSDRLAIPYLNITPG
jgi:hypothetical protein